MLKRTVTGAALVAVLGVMIFCIPSWGFALFAGLLAAVAVWEIQGAVSEKRQPWLLAVSLLFSAAYPLVAVCWPQYGSFLILGFFLCTYGIYLFLYEKEVSVLQLFTAVGMSVLLAMAFSSMALIRHSSQGTKLILTVFLGSWLSDTFAYLVGSLFGKHKLCPKMSPKKSVEGALGAVFFTALAFVLYDMAVLKGGSWLFAALGGILCSVLAQMGDLNASCLKRKLGIKDYGALLPGHGGVLDRFDSVVLTAPVLYIFYTFTGML